MSFDIQESHTPKGPKYIEIAEDLHMKIRTGVYPPGAILPKESDLEIIYQVSRITIRKAMQLLNDWHLISRKRGSGTFVRKDNAEHNAFELTGFVEEISNQGKLPSSKILAFELIDADSIVAEKLQITKGVQIYKVKRLRLIDNLPEVLEITYMPFSFFPDLSIEVMMNSKYEYIEKIKGLTIDSSRQIVRAVLLEKDLAEILDVDPLLPVIRVDSVGKLNNSVIFEYSIHYFKGEQYEFAFSAKRKNKA
ncbi:GntR family transcriptional regulator [Thorsellia kenyensis]|uniref:GntR family transcriptional regulator n=1 Tax=Thorsellia kenyensis TaxID=1549888 RepID=A0ABV6C941_9GAMM